MIISTNQNASDVQGTQQSTVRKGKRIWKMLAVVVYDGYNVSGSTAAGYGGITKMYVRCSIKVLKEKYILILVGWNLVVRLGSTYG